MPKILNIFYGIMENAGYFAVLALTFLSAFLLIFALYVLVARKNKDERYLKKFFPSAKTTLRKKPRLLETETGGLVTRLAKPLNDIVADSPGALNRKIRLRLIQAGWRSNATYYNFIAAKIVLGIVLPVGYLVSRFFFTFSLQIFLFCALLIIIGFGLPDTILGFAVRARQQRILRGLPDALDLMVVCVEAGLGLDMTFRRVGEEIRPLCTDLSDEFQLTNLEIRAGKARNECFKNMALRTGLQEINNLMTILIQTSRFGTSLAKALRVHSDAMRIKRRQIAEEKAAKSTVKLIFPLVFFIFPAIFVVLVGPGVIRIIKVLFPAMGAG
jgi:tight adherence protein C